MSSIGPQLPPHLAATTATTTIAPPDDSDSDSDFGPSLPPDMVASHSQAKKVLGPTLPPHYVPATSTHKKETPLSALYSDDDDDEAVGPSPLPAGYRHSDDDAVRAFREREELAEEKRREEERGRGKPKREEWMLLPPENVDLLSTMDPTKLKSRTFAQSTKTTSGKKDTGPNLWTETPAERQQRLEDEMMGRKRKAVTTEEEEEETDEMRRKRQRDRELKREVERHNKSARNTSLLDAHSKKAKASAKAEKDKDEGGAPVVWDRDTMMGSGRLMDDGKRASIVKNAKELGGRFGGGGFL